jgi:transcriptional regulator with XRE-family HTH domain
MKANETLAAFVRRVRAEKNLSLTDVERQSARHGAKIASSYVSKIENGDTKNPSPEKIKALARGLDVPEDEITAVAFGKAPKTEAEARETRMLHYFRELPGDRQDDLIRMTKALHNAHAKQGSKRSVA